MGVHGTPIALQLMDSIILGRDSDSGNGFTSRIRSASNGNMIRQASTAMSSRIRFALLIHTGRKSSEGSVALRHGEAQHKVRPSADANGTETKRQAAASLSRQASISSSSIKPSSRAHRLRRPACLRRSVVGLCSNLWTIHASSSSDRSSRAS
jgi:hypothetical protein